eukprot:4521128-Pyramimonas_sp.AAC.1
MVIDVVMPAAMMVAAVRCMVVSVMLVSVISVAVLTAPAMGVMVTECSPPLVGGPCADFFWSLQMRVEREPILKRYELPVPSMQLLERRR